MPEVELEYADKGLVRFRTLTDDYDSYEELTHSLIGRGSNLRYRPGDRERVNVLCVDLQRR